MEDTEQYWVPPVIPVEDSWIAMTNILETWHQNLVSINRTYLAKNPKHASSLMLYAAGGWWWLPCNWYVATVTDSTIATTLCQRCKICIFKSAYGYSIFLTQHYLHVPVLQLCPNTFSSTNGQGCWASPCLCMPFQLASLFIFVGLPWTLNLWPLHD